MMRPFLLLVLLLLPVFGKPDSAQLVDEANKLYQEKNYDDAIKAYTKAFEADRKNAKALMFRGLVSSLKGDWQACVKDLDQALGIEPRNVEFLNTRAFAYLHTSEFDLAKEDFQAIEKVEEGAGKKARFLMAQNLLRRARNNSFSDKGDRKLALLDYNRVLALVPPNDMILYERASVLIDLKDYKAALVDMDKVIKINGQISELGDTYNTRAEVRRALGDEDGAKADEAEAKKRSAHLQPKKASKPE